MSVKFLLLVSFVLCSMYTELQGRDNEAIKLDCWPVALKYKTFTINITLSTRNVEDQVLAVEDTYSPKEIDFDPTRKTIVVVHGLVVSSNHFDKITALRDALLEWGDVNVVLVNWEKGCNNFLKYYQAVLNTKYVAFVLKDDTIELWKEENELDDNWTPELHFVGFSLGAHVCGQAAELLRVEDNLLVDRVTGLDPAGPCFEPPSLPLRLARVNALFVDIIHTDGAISEDEAFGLLEPIGHVDFYVNGGRKQPGCSLLRRRKRSAESLLKLLVHAIENGACSHNRAFAIFAETVKQAVSQDCSFVAYPWTLNTAFNSSIELTNEDWPEMGINADLYDYNITTYYVPTTAVAPYCNVTVDS